MAGTFRGYWQEGSWKGVEWSRIKCVLEEKGDA